VIVMLREYPNATEQALATKSPADPIVSEFGRAFGLIARRLRVVAAQYEGAMLSMTQGSVLMRLEEGGPSTIADLARREGIKPQTMGTAVAALEQMGIVKRKAHPIDRRQVNIQITPKGSALRKTYRDKKWNWLAEAEAQLDAQDRETLLAASAVMRKMLGIAVATQ
jgi:DNA-binding MarR family transcriptional regulator